MARLIVSAVAEDAIAKPGNREPLYIVISVTDVNGEPVSGLTEANITVETKIGRVAVEIKEVYLGGGPQGFYHVNVLPVQSYAWKSGPYVFAILVIKDSDRGQALASALMD